LTLTCVQVYAGLMSRATRREYRDEIMTVVQVGSGKTPAAGPRQLKTR